MKSKQQNVTKGVLFPFFVIPCTVLLGVFPLQSGLSDGLSLFWSGCAAAAVLFWGRPNKLSWSPAVGFAGVLLLLVCITAWLNHYAYAASWLWYAIYALAALFAGLFASELLRHLGRERYVALLLGALWWCALVYAVLSLLRYYGVLRLFVPWSLPASGRMGGLWMQANLNNTMMWLGLIASSYRFNGKQMRWQLLGCCVLFGWGIACSASRMSWVFAVSLLCLCAVSYLPKWRHAELKPYRASLLSACVGVLVLFVVVTPINDAFNSWLTQQGWLDRAQSVSILDRDPTHDQARVTEALKTVKAIPDMSIKQLLLGVGPGRYAHFSAHEDATLPASKLAPGTWTNSHNIFTMLFVEMGVVGLIWLIALLAYIALRVLSKPMNKESFFLVAAIGVLFVHSNLEYPLWYAWFLLFMFMLIVPLGECRDLTIDSDRLKKTVSVVILVANVVLFSFLAIDYAKFVSIRMDKSAGLSEFKQLLVMSNGVLIGPYANLLRYRELAPATKGLDWQLDEVNKMLDWQPRDLVMLRKYSLLLLAGNYSAACDTAKTTARRYPRSAPIMQDHHKLLHLSGDIALKLDTCIEAGLEPRHETIKQVRKDNQNTLRGNEIRRKMGTL